MQKTFWTVLLAMCVFCGAVGAEPEFITPADTVTLEWGGGNNATKFYIYARLFDGTGQKKLGESTTTRFTYKFSEEAAYIFGVQSARITTLPGMSSPVEQVSEIIWSDVPAHCLDGKTFGRYFLNPFEGAPTGLH